MMTAEEGSTLTALDLLFGPGAEAAAAETLVGEISSLGGGQELDHALAHLPETVKKAAAQEAGTTMAALLKVDLIGVLVRGWREHRDIVSAARRTLAAPGSTELVSMSAHEVTLDQQPSVSVLVDGQQVAVLHLGLSIVFDVTALLLGISGGRLAAVRSGRCDITAVLAVQSADLLVKRARLELPGVISLQRGIRLLPVGEYPVSENPAGDHRGSDPRGGEYPSDWIPGGRPFGAAEPEEGPLSRCYAPAVDPEAVTLLYYLEGQRASVFSVLDGLPDAALRRAVFPSGWTCLGLLHHLAVDDERYWFRGVAAGEPVEVPAEDDSWLVEPDTAAGAVFDLYRDEIRRSNAIIEAMPLDAPARGYDRQWAEWGWPSADDVVNLRWIILHMIEETAQHAGHLDTARELLDGRTGPPATGPARLIRPSGAVGQP